MVKKQRYAVFYGEFENEKKKGQKNFDLPERGYEPQIFSNFPAHGLFEFSCQVKSQRSN